MQFKQKLAYMALGGLLVFMGQLLPNMINHNATAQGNKSLEFDSVKCRNLVVVDESGKTRVKVGLSSDRGNFGYDLVQLFNPNGIPVLRAGTDNVSGNGWLSVHGGNGGVCVDLIGQTFGGSIRVSGGMKEKTPRIQIDAEDSFSKIRLFNKDVKEKASISVYDGLGGSVETHP